MVNREVLRHRKPITVNYSLFTKKRRAYGEGKI